MFLSGLSTFSLHDGLLSASATEAEFAAEPAAVFEAADDTEDEEPPAAAEEATRVAVADATVVVAVEPREKKKII